MLVIGADIGARFVDLAVSRDGTATVAKQDVGTAEPAAAILAALDAASRAQSFDLAAVRELRVGSTGLVNALLDRRGPRVGLLVTAGFGDVLLLGRQNRQDLYHPVARSPAPTFLVDRADICELGGRIAADGGEAAPLDTEALDRACRRFAEAGIRSIAVCLLFAHVEPRHELACVARLRETLPGAEICLSHEIDPQAREYERTVSTCLEAWLRPQARAMIETLERGLRSRGFRGALALCNARGELMDVRDALLSVSSLLAGGPACAALAGSRAAALAGARQALCVDIGSSSTDITYVAGGRLPMTCGSVLAGVPQRRTTIDVESLPLGGMRPVRPGVAGATCLDDALRRLGRLPRTAGTGAEMAEADARDAIAEAEAAIAGAILRHAVSRNVDPARATLVAMGGLGAHLCCGIAGRLGMRSVILPPAPAAAGALGLLAAVPMRDATLRFNETLARLDDDGLRRRIEDAVAHLRARSPAIDAPARPLFEARLAPDDAMHPVVLETGTAVPTRATLRAALETHYEERHGVPCPGAGYLHEIVVRLPETEAGTCSGWSANDAELLGRFRNGAESNDALQAFAGLTAGWEAEEIAAGCVRLMRQAGTEAFPEGPNRRLRLFQHRLDGIAQSMQETLFRCSVSPVVREGNDAAAAVLAVDGELLAMSDAIPLLLGALEGATQAILRAYPVVTMRPGDLYVVNDPYAGGTHLPDLTIVAPVFAEGSVVAIAATILHHQDVGGMRAGSVPPDATEIFQEGLRLPPLRLGTGGTVDDAMCRLVMANSRAPETVLGDIGAQLAALNRARTALLHLVAETGTAEFLEASAACRDRAAGQMATLLSGLPAGPHRGADGLDPTPGLGSVEIRVALSIGDGRLVADFTGTSPQVAAPVNCVRSGPVAAVFQSLLTLAPDDILRNGGLLRPVELVLPEASVIDAAPPAPVNARMGVVRATTSAVLQALSQAARGRLPAANSGMSYVLAFSRRDAAGRMSVTTEIIAGGAGGGPDDHGAAAISTDVGNAMNLPAEALEARVPVRLVSAEVRGGSGGAGRYRGGDGIRRVYLALADDIAVSLRGERFGRVPAGHAGGGAPSGSAARVLRRDGRVENLSSRSSLIMMAGDTLEVESCGGAGWGEARREETGRS